MVGAYGMTSSSNAAVVELLAKLGTNSPWFMAAIYFGSVAGFQALAATSVVTAARGLVYDIFVPDFMPGLDAPTSILLGRVCVGVLMLASVLLATRAPTAAVSLGALALHLQRNWSRLWSACAGCAGSRPRPLWSVRSSDW